MNEFERACELLDAISSRIMKKANSPDYVGTDAWLPYTVEEIAIWNDLTNPDNLNILEELLRASHDPQGVIEPVLLKRALEVCRTRAEKLGN